MMTEIRRSLRPGPTFENALLFLLLAAMALFLAFVIVGAILA